jgi:hypothetical protein
MPSCQRQTSAPRSRETQLIPVSLNLVVSGGVGRFSSCGLYTRGSASPPAGFDGARPLIRSDQMYHHYRGDPLEVLLLDPDGRGEVRAVGEDIGSGMRPQLLITGGAPQQRNSSLPPFTPLSPLLHFVAGAVEELLFVKAVPDAQELVFPGLDEFRAC